MDCNQNFSDLKNKLKEYSFALYDTILYLDSHPDNAKALAYYAALCDKFEEIVEIYEEKYGPLTVFSNQGETWNWIKSPWPWESEAN